MNSLVFIESFEFLIKGKKGLIMNCTVKIVLKLNGCSDDFDYVESVGKFNRKSNIEA